MNRIGCMRLLPDIGNLLNNKWQIKSVIDICQQQGSMFYKNVIKHGTYTIVLWYNPKQWLWLNASDSMMMIMKHYDSLHYQINERFLSPTRLKFSMISFALHFGLALVALCLEDLGQYHGHWCPGSLCHQVISSHGIDYVEWMSSLSSMRKEDLNYLDNLIPSLRNNEKCENELMITQNLIC